MTTHSRRTWLTAALATVTAVCLAATADAQPGPKPKLGAKPIEVVGPGTVNAPWRVTVTTDKGNYVPGDLVFVTVVSERPGYLYLFNIDSMGQTTCIFPNTFSTGNEIQANAPITVPTPNTFAFRVSGPAGNELVKAVVMSHPSPELKLDMLTRKIGNSPVKSISPLKFKRLIVDASGGDPNVVGPDPGIGQGNQPPVIPNTDKPPFPNPNPGQNPGQQQTVQQIQQQIQQQNPGQFVQKMKEWATGECQFNIIEGKIPEKPPIGKPPVPPVPEKPPVFPPKTDKSAK